MAATALACRARPAGLPGVGAGLGRRSMRRQESWPARQQVYRARQRTTLLPDFEAMARLFEICSSKPMRAFDGLKARITFPSRPKPDVPAQTDTKERTFGPP